MRGIQARDKYQLSTIKGNRWTTMAGSAFDVEIMTLNFAQ
jgi:hypothetical protein